MNGGKLAGGNPEHGRVDNDYYATDPKAVEMLLRQYEFNGNKMFDPCMGSGAHGIVALEEGRNFIGIELDKEYYEIAKERIEAIANNPQT